MRAFLRILVANLALAVPIAIVVPLAMVLLINFFFDGLYALNPITSRLGPAMTLTLYSLAWFGVVGVVVWMVRRRLVKVTMRRISIAAGMPPQQADVSGRQMGVWDKRIRGMDWLAIAPAIVLAGLTIWTASYPIVDTAAWLFGGFAWSIIGIIWSGVLLATVNDRGSRAAAVVLLGGAIVANPFAAGFSLLFFAFTGTFGLAAVFLTGLALLGVIVVRSRPRRLAWIVAPAIVLVMFGVLMTNAPRLARLAMSEPALTNYAESARTGELPAYYDGGLNVGAIPIYAAYNEWGGLHLVTGYVGILDDDEAGIAYFPSGLPTNGIRYEHLLGPWYRWYPY
ncbi:MAG: hypothetical protein ABI725_05980 [Chloroflexota bacterium]